LSGRPPRPGAMFAPGCIRVITKEPGSKSVKLREVLKDERWSAAVDGCLMAPFYLTELPYAEFQAAPGSLVLSYMWEDKVTVSCEVADPAEVVTKIAGEVNLSFLVTPTLDWTHLWVDFLAHLNDVEGRSQCLESSGTLYWENTVLPQYCLLGSCEKLMEALSRGWVHQELALGRIHRGAVQGLLRIVCYTLVEQAYFVTTIERKPWQWLGLRVLRSFIEKRVRLCDGWDELPVIRSMNDGWESVWSIPHWFAKVNNIKLVPSLLHAHHYQLSRHEVQQRVDIFLDAVCARQMGDDPAENLANLPVKCVIHGFCLSNYWDAGDIYVAPVLAFGAACGLPVRDPLKEHRLRHGENPDRPLNPNGSLRFEWSDLDLHALNDNLKLLRISWCKVVDEDLRPVLIYEHHELEVDNTKRPPGTRTLGLGPLRRSDLPEKGTCKVNPRSVLRLKEDGQKLCLGITQFYEKNDPTLPRDVVGQEFSAKHFEPGFL